MRLLVIAVTVLVYVVITPPAYAQEASAPCHPISPTSRVVVHLRDGTSIEGTLLCLTATEAVLAREASTTATSMQAIRRIQTRADPIWDGALKGAVIPLALWAAFCHGCDGSPMLRAVGAYALIGLTWDSLDRNTRTIYAGSPRPSIKWRIRF